MVKGTIACNSGGSYYNVYEANVYLSALISTGVTSGHEGNAIRINNQSGGFATIYNDTDYVVLMYIGYDPIGREPGESLSFRHSEQVWIFF